MIKKTLLLLTVSILFLSLISSCGILGPSLPSGIQGKWVQGYLSGARKVITLGANTVRYQVYDDYGYLSTDWDREIVEVNTDKEWFLDDNGSGYYWMFHLEGSTLYLKKLDLNQTPSSVALDWWSNPAYDYAYRPY